MDLLLDYVCPSVKDRERELVPQLLSCLSALQLSLLLSGCGGIGGAPPTKNEPAAAAAMAIETYDRNGDGQLSGDELSNASALIASGRRIDRNGDNVLTKDEIQVRMEELEPQADYIPLDVRILTKGRPLVGAELTLSPAPFMGENYQTFTGTTDEAGSCFLQGDGKELPGVPVGFYHARVVQSAQGIDLTRGIEIADDTTGNRLEISL